MAFSSTPSPSPSSNRSVWHCQQPMTIVWILLMRSVYTMRCPAFSALRTVNSNGCHVVMSSVSVCFDNNPSPSLVSVHPWSLYSSITITIIPMIRRCCILEVIFRASHHSWLHKTWKCLSGSKPKIQTLVSCRDMIEFAKVYSTHQFADCWDNVSVSLFHTTTFYSNTLHFTSSHTHTHTLVYIHT